MPFDGDYEAIKKFCLDHLIPAEFWQNKYSDGLEENCQQEYPNLKLPNNISQIKFDELIESLDCELSEVSGFPGLQAAEEQGLACVKLVKWLLENRRL